MNRLTKPKFRRAGSALILSMGILLLLAVISALVMNVLGNRHRQVYQAAAWHSALLAAESGVDMAVAELRRSLQDPSGAFSAWTRADGTSGGPGNGATFFTFSALFRTGEGGQRSWARIEVAAPPELRDSRGTQWYRVRSIGYSEVPGGRVLAGNPLDVELRKLDFRVDHRTQTPVATPQASRLVEAIVKPVGAFRLALLSDDRIDMNNLNIVVDSYDSRDATKSTNGFYDPAKRQENGDIASNGPLIDVGNAHIYGDASTNNGQVLRASNVTGEIRDDFYQQLFPVSSPSMVPSPGTPSTVTNTTTVAASAGAPTMVILSQINLSGPKTFTITGAADGSPTFAQILVNGDVDLSGQAQIILGRGVNVRMFVKGDGDFTGNGVANPNDPLSFQLYGVQRLPDASGNISRGAFKVAGNGGFRAELRYQHGGWRRCRQHLRCVRRIHDQHDRCSGRTLRRSDWGGRFDCGLPRGELVRGRSLMLVATWRPRFRTSSRLR